MPGFLQDSAKATTTTQAPQGVQGTYIRPLTPDGSDPGIALILINMQGGMSHFDTFDPRGENVDRIFKGPFDARRLGDTFMHKLQYGKFHMRGTVRTNDPADNPFQI